MPYRSFDPDLPDPGTVDTDDRCDYCGAGEDEPCEADCRCEVCLRRRARAFAVLHGQPKDAA